MDFSPKDWLAALEGAGASSLAKTVAAALYEDTAKLLIPAGSPLEAGLLLDDLSKIDAHLDREMTRFMAIHGIRTTTFNERDFVSGFRVRAIAYDLATSIVWAARRRAP